MFAYSKDEFLDAVCSFDARSPRFILAEELENNSVTCFLGIAYYMFMHGFQGEDVQKLRSTMHYVNKTGNFPEKSGIF